MPVSKLRTIKRFLLSFALPLLLAVSSANASVSAEDGKFLRTVQKDALGYFLDYSDPQTGLTRDASRPGAPASIAATGFSLASLAIGQKEGWLSYAQAYGQILKTLKTLDSRAQHKNGFFYHFLDPATGRRTWGSEASSIDTALAIAGAFVAAQAFPGTPIESLTNRIYARVNWKWMLNGSDRICMGWKPENGFLPYYWDSYNELMILQALAIGSPTFPIPSSAWDQWERFEEDYKGERIIYSFSGSLFTYQYAHAFIDFRKLNDKGINYFENSKKATLANRQFCIDNAAEHKTYSDNAWGLTASLGPGGYKAYGAKPGQALHDGTVAPYGSAGSIVFTPEKSIEALQFFKEQYGKKIYGKYGFKDSFNLDKDWWADEYLGIDVGIIVLMIENYLTEDVWKGFMELPCVRNWVRLCQLAEK